MEENNIVDFEDFKEEAEVINGETIDSENGEVINFDELSKPEDILCDKSKTRIGIVAGATVIFGVATLIIFQDKVKDKYFSIRIKMSERRVKREETKQTTWKAKKAELITEENVEKD
mgnify:CR=1 FL=1